MKPLYPLRFLLVYTLGIAFPLLFGTPSYAQEYALYDNAQQLESRIKEAGNSVLVVNFWATWCKPCVEELPCFDELREQYAGKDLQVLLVSLDFKSQIEKKFVPFLLAQRPKSEVALLADQDVNTWIPRIYEAWDGAIPATIVFKGNQRKFSLGKFDSLEELDAFVQPFLAMESGNLKPVTCTGK